MSAGYVVNSGASAVALASTVAKTILGVVAASGVTARLVEAGVSFDGVTSTAVPVLVELCDSTGATAGTPGATTGVAAPAQIRGSARTAQCSGGNAYSAEPTVLTVRKHWLIHAQTGTVFQLPLGREIEHTGAGGLFLRCTAAAAVNVRAYMEWEEG